MENRELPHSTEPDHTIPALEELPKGNSNEKVERMTSLSPEAGLKKSEVLSFLQQRQLKIIEQVPKLFWFILLLVTVILLFPNIQKLLDRAGKFKGYGVEIEFDKNSFDVSGKDRTKQQDSIYKETFRYLGNRQQEQLINRVNLLQPIFQWKQFRILWVDDHPINNVYVAKILEQIGFKIETVTTSTAGLELLNGSISDTSLKRFDLIISDYSRDSKDDLNGLAFAQQAKQIDYSIPIILYTSSYDESSLGLPEQVFAVANRPDYLMNYILDVLERGDTPFPK